MTYQRPLAYLLGVEGVALLRAFAGEHGREFTETRIAEIRRLLDAPALAAAGVEAPQVGTVDGYRVWSRTYDRPGNGIFAYEEPYVERILATIEPGDAVDAGCGSGRWSSRLAALGHRVTGVDSSPDMLARARTRVPQGRFHLGRLDEMPIPDAHADVVICALALTHVPDLAPVFAEFARILRPGGHLVVTDVHHETVMLGSIPRVRFPDGSPGMLPAHRHRASDYLGAALPRGFQLRSCEEPRVSALPSPATTSAVHPAHEHSLVAHVAPADLADPGPASSPADNAAQADPDFLAGDVDPGPWDAWPWSLQPLVGDAHAAAQAGLPATVIWHFQRARD